MHVHRAVDFGCLGLEVDSVGRPVVATHALCLAVEYFHDGLGLASMSSTRLLRTLHQTVLLNEFGVCLLSKFVALVRHLELLGDDSEALRAVQRRVMDLGLEREVRDCCQVKVFHLEKDRDGLHSILKGEHGIGCNISELPRKDSIILGKIFLQLLSELESLV